MNSFSFVRYAFVSVLSCVVLGFVSLVIFLLTFSPSIEFTGGVKAEMRNIQQKEQLLGSIQDVLSSLSGGNKVIPRITELGEVTTILVPFSSQFSLEGRVDPIKKLLVENEKTNSGQELLSYSLVGSTFGSYARKTAIRSLVVGIVCMVLYVFFAFAKLREVIDPLALGLMTTLTMFFDALVPLGFYGVIMYFFPVFQVDSLVILAILSIIGYSINDTIIVLDRMRENLLAYQGKKPSTQKVGEIIDTSIHQTLRRSIGTSLSTLLVLITMAILGEGDMQRISLLMAIGIGFGTFSSIFLSAPGIYLMVAKNNRKSS